MAKRKQNHNPRLRYGEPVLVRRSDPRFFERGILVWQRGHENNAPRRDPQAILERMSGLRFTRDFCVVSYLDGLVSTGLQVNVFENQRDQTARPHFNDCGRQVLVYWLVGYLEGINQIDDFRIWLGQFSLGRRQLICEEAAHYLQSHIGAGVDSLRHMLVPVGALLY